MEVKVSTVIMSHLSDLQGHSGSMTENERQLRFNFVKYLVLNFKDTDTYIDPKAEYMNFQIKFGKLLNNG
jgi:hypothetical protein